MTAIWPLLLFGFICIALMSGFPVAFTLAGVSLLFALIGSLFGAFDPVFLEAVPNRLYGIMTNETLLAVPLFVLMGVTLEKSQIAERLLSAMAATVQHTRGGLGYAVFIVGALMAASTGIVGATVVTMGLLALPTMLKQNYDPRLAAGSICAAGTLGQIIPPSIVLILLGDVISNAFQQAQLRMGLFSSETVSVGELFAAAVIPGLLLVGAYLLYMFCITRFKPERAPLQANDGARPDWIALSKAMLPPLILIVAVLGSILAGIATPTEAAALGALGAFMLALLQKRLTIKITQQVLEESLKVTCMVFLILIGASIFSLVFRGFGGDDVVHSLLSDLPGGKWTALIIVMILMFALGFVLDFIEITFVVVPIVGPVLLAMGFDPLWLGILIAVNLQTSFLTPPFGFALFYLRGVADAQVTTADIYRGVAPFVLIQIAILVLLALFPALSTWLPSQIYR